MALTGLAPTVPGSLRGRQRQSQTSSMYSGASQKVENGLNWFGTDGSWKSARASKTVADRFNVLGSVPKGRKWPSLNWHRRFLEVCEGVKDSRRPVQCTWERPKRSKMAFTELGPTVPGSLRGRQRQSQTGSMYSGGSQKVENGLNWFGTDGSWKSARASKTVADQFNVLGSVPKGRKWP